MNFDVFINSELESTLNDIHTINIIPISTKLIDEVCNICHFLFSFCYYLKTFQFKNNSTLFNFDEKMIQLKELTKSNNIELQNFVRTLIPTMDSLRKDLASSINKRYSFIAENLSSINSQSTNLTKDIPRWILSIKNAQGLLNNNLQNFLVNSSKSLIKDVQFYFDSYFERLKKQVMRKIEEFFRKGFLFKIAVLLISVGHWSDQLWPNSGNFIVRGFVHLRRYFTPFCKSFDLTWGLKNDLHLKLSERILGLYRNLFNIKCAFNYFGECS